MKFLKKFKEVFLALLPIMVIVLFVHLFVFKFETKTILKFFIALLLVCLGEVFLLTGIDSTIMPMGELMVGTVNKTSKLIVFIVFAMFFGTCATIAEPDVTVFSGQLIGAGVSVAKSAIVFAIGAGVGLFIAFGIIRIVKHISIKYIYLVIFAIIFLLCTQVEPEFIAIAFDAGGATTGIITAPFLLAVSTGISNRFSTGKTAKSEVFGMVGMASLGPIISILLIFILAGKGNTTAAVVAENVNIFVDVLKNTALAIIPIAAVFFIYDMILIKLPFRKILSFIIGLVVTFVGLYLFLFGIDFGISQMGAALGGFIEKLSTPVIIIFCISLGFIITFCEPSVLVLSKQVQNVTKGNIPSFVVMISIAVSMATAILLAVLKILYNINFFYIILIGYALALILMFFVSPRFTSIAFDSGGVASGPMTSAFILPAMLEIASHTSGALSGFGVIGIVGMCPIVVLQILGLVYKLEIYTKNKQEEKRRMSLTYSTEMYSNMVDLELEYKEMMEAKNNEKKER